MAGTVYEPQVGVVPERLIQVKHFTMLARNNYLIKKPINNSESIILTKHVIDKTVSALDAKIYNNFIAFYYALMLGDSNAFYESLDGLSSAMKNHTSSKITNQPMKRITSVTLKLPKF